MEVFNKMFQIVMVKESSKVAWGEEAIGNDVYRDVLRDSILKERFHAWIRKLNLALDLKLYRFANCRELRSGDATYDAVLFGKARVHSIAQIKVPKFVVTT
jgi:hypothetical protein